MTPHQQRLKALEKGNMVRSQKAEIKKLIKAGKLDAVVVIETTSLPLTVKEILLAIPGFGVTKLRRLIRETRIDASRPVAVPSFKQTPITAEQRATLVLYVRATGLPHQARIAA